MTGKAPSDFHPQLTDARLRRISESLLEVLYETELELATVLDDGYTRGTATFGRQRNAIIQMCQGGQYDWLKLTNGGMDVTFEIAGVPCRFFADDPASPKKPGYFRRNESDKLFQDEVDQPEMFRFVVAKAQTPEEEAEVFFVGYNAQMDEVFRWQYGRSTPVLASVDATLPKEVALPPPLARVPSRAPDAKEQDSKAAGDSHAPQA